MPHRRRAITPPPAAPKPEMTALEQATREIHKRLAEGWRFRGVCSLRPPGMERLPLERGFAWVDRGERHWWGAVRVILPHLSWEEGG